jgi:hypothetical protein
MALVQGIYPDLLGFLISFFFTNRSKYLLGDSRFGLVFLRSFFLFDCRPFALRRQLSLVLPFHYSREPDGPGFGFFRRLGFRLLALRRQLSLVLLLLFKVAGRS